MAITAVAMPAHVLLFCGAVPCRPMPPIFTFFHFYRESNMTSLTQKLHMTLIAAAGIGTALIYTTYQLALIGGATGVAVALSIRLFLAHKKAGFANTSKLDWVLLIVVSVGALGFQLAEMYTVQGVLLVFTAVRALMMYFTLYSTREA